MSCISCIVSGAIVKPSGAKRAAKRATRSTRNGSSTKAGETWRRTRASRSRRPPYGSTTSLLPCRRIDGLRHRVDREVTPREVFLERDVGREARGEAVVAGAGLAFGAGERVLVAGLRMQEDGKVLADGAVAEREQVVGLGADDHVVAFGEGPSEQRVAHGAAHQVGFHCRIVAEFATGMVAVGPGLGFDSDARKGRHGRRNRIRIPARRHAPERLVGRYSIDQGGAASHARRLARRM